MPATPLQLDAYFIDAIEAEALKGYKEDRGAVELALDVTPQHLFCKGDALAHQVVLTVTFEPAKAGSAPYRGRIVGRAFFHVDEELDEEKTAQYVIVNGSAILLGLLRGQLAQVTALGRWGTFLLPPVNLVEAFAASAKKPKPPVKRQAANSASKPNTAPRRKATPKSPPAGGVE